MVHMLRLEKRDCKEQIELDVLHSHLSQQYQKILHLETEISDLNSSIHLLQYEMKEINPEKSVVYRTLRGDKGSEKQVAIAAGVAGGMFGGVSGLMTGSSLLSVPILGSMVAAGGFGLGAAALGAGSVALYSSIKNNWSDPILLEYNEINIPFIEAKPHYSAGKLEIIDSQPEQGLFKAWFYPYLFSEATIKVEILVKKTNLPKYAKRINSIVNEIENNRNELKNKQDELAITNQKKNLLVEEVAAAEMSVKRHNRLRLFDTASSIKNGSEMRQEARVVLTV